MRNERAEAMSRHPASGVAVAGPDGRPGEPTRSPVSEFFEALDELEMVVSLYGTASIDAAEARANVRRTRELAAESWRQKNAPAA